MNRILIILFLCSVSITGVHAQWIQQNSGTGVSLRDIRFANNSTGWIAGYNGTILKTTDGGINWLPQNTGTTYSLLSLFTIDGVNLWTVGTNGVVLKSTNGGTYWVSKSSGTSNNLSSIYFINSSLGWAGGDYDMLKTTNGGDNWFTQTTGLNIPVSSMCFFNENTGIVVGGTSIKKTTNGGFNWITVQFYCCHSLMSSCFVNLSTGWAVGTLTYPNQRFGEALKTINSGSNWNGLTTPSGDREYYSVFFTNSNLGWICGYQGLIIKTDNGGTNWYHQLSGTSNHLLSVYFVNTLTGWISGSAGTILKTTNGGGPVGITQIGTEILQFFSLSQNYPNPFNPVTKIKFDIPTPLNPPEGGTQEVRLIIYDILGTEIAVLVNERLSSGTYEIEWDASNYPSGIYFYKLLTSEFIDTKKMVLIK